MDRNSHMPKDDRPAKRCFVLRATKVFRPFSQQQIEKGKLDGKFLPTDKISHLANGPWQDITTANLVTQNKELVSEQTSIELIKAEVVIAETAAVDSAAAEVPPRLPILARPQC